MPKAGSCAVAPKFFRDSDQLRAWLAKHHASRSELWVGLYKKGSGQPSITWPELVDQLLCFGWIDGVRKSVDEKSYANRVTPRRQGSTWSAINLKRARELIDLGLMEPAGRAAYDARDEAKTNRYSFERDQVSLTPEYEAMFRKNRKAWRFFESQPPGYRKTATWWVMSAKREDTRRRRLDVLISDSANGERIGLLKR
ncbi:MAG TPA: YdeI/OmpD-associated family protein [Longimicrobiales bacterium]|nr:YdeI/OmpD-associated family protein [Longimicrobiales bacterium]